VESHRPEVAAADAPEQQAVAFLLGHFDVAEALGRLTDDPDQLAGVRVVRRHAVMRGCRRYPFCLGSDG
jgi:hypothetical protein